MGGISLAEDEFGTDICWTASNDSLGTVSAKDNLIQSIINRIQTNYSELNWVYENYGCNYRDYLGLPANDTSLEFIKNSLKQSIEEEPRINEYEITVAYAGDGTVNVVLNIDGTQIEMNLGD